MDLGWMSGSGGEGGLVPFLSFGFVLFGGIYTYIPANFTYRGWFRGRGWVGLVITAGGAGIGTGMEL